MNNAPHATGRRPVLSLLCLFLMVFACLEPPSALAHASLVRSAPPAGATVQAPARIDLWFNELLEDGYNQVSVVPTEELGLNPGEQVNLARRTPVLDPQNRTHLTVEIDPLPAGNYTVEWRVLSRDGHSAPGRFNFKVAGSP